MLHCSSNLNLSGKPALYFVMTTLNGRHVDVDEFACRTCGEMNAEKRCSACKCKQVFYCNATCQKMYWFTHKKVRGTSDVAISIQSGATNTESCSYICVYTYCQILFALCFCRKWQKSPFTGIIFFTFQAVWNWRLRKQLAHMT